MKKNKKNSTCKGKLRIYIGHDECERSQVPYSSVHDKYTKHTGRISTWEGKLRKCPAQNEFERHPADNRGSRTQDENKANHLPRKVHGDSRVRNHEDLRVGAPEKETAEPYRA